MTAPRRDVILLPKKLRAEWMDAMALDTELSNAAFRTGCVIGHHFNRHCGEVFIKQETIARIMGISDRTVWSAIKELEQRGYLAVKRRELGNRTSDGRRVCGGKGVANVYLPCFERSQITSSKRGAKLAARCNLWWEERSQKSTSKVAADCDPTHDSPSGSNPSEVDHDLGEAGERLRQRLGRDAFVSWFSKVIVESFEDGVVTLTAPSRFVSDWIRTHFVDEILVAWQTADASVAQVVVKARTGRTDRPQRTADSGDGQ